MSRKILRNNYVKRYKDIINRNNTLYDKGNKDFICSDRKITEEEIYNNKDRVIQNIMQNEGSITYITLDCINYAISHRQCKIEAQKFWRR